MKVLHIIDSGGLYGAEKMLVALTSGQAAMDVQPCVCSIGLPGEGEKPLERALHTAGVDVWPLRMRKGLNLAVGLALVQEARRRGFEVLHTHGYKGNILLALIPRFLRRIPWVVTTHGWSHGAGSFRSRLYQWLDARAIAAADRVVAVSETMLSLGPFARRRVASRSTVIANAVPRPRTTGAVDPQIAEFCEPSVTAVIVGRLDAVKGHADLLEAMRSVPLRLLVLGDGPLRASLELQCRNLGIADRVLFAGFREDVADCMTAADFLVMPSLSEGLPITLLEAIGMGLPVVATRVGGVSQLVENTSAGLLVPPGDVKALTSALASMTTDEALRGSHRETMVASSAPLFDTAAMVRAYRAVYEQETS